jgi:hypothetical protein
MVKVTAQLGNVIAEQVYALAWRAGLIEVSAPHASMRTA